MISRRAFSFSAAGLLALPAHWLNPKKVQGRSVVRDGEPIVGAWKVTLPRDSHYRIWIDGIFSNYDHNSLGLSHFDSRGNGREIGFRIGAPQPGEGGDFVLATDVEGKAGDVIALDDGADDVNKSMPRMVAVPVRWA